MRKNERKSHADGSESNENVNKALRKLSTQEESEQRC